MRLQGIAEKWVKAATVVPNSKTPKATAAALGLKYEPWMSNLRSKDLHNGALIAMDYQTGDIVAYVGVGEPERDQGHEEVPAPLRRPGERLAAAGLGVQAGRLLRPGSRTRAITAASMFMDVVTNFGGGYTPTDADNLERGPVRMRDALSFSLNIPAVKAGIVIGNDNIQKQAEAMGIQFQNGKVDATAAFPLGVEVVHPIDLIRAYGVLGDNGKLAEQTTIISVVDSNGKTDDRRDRAPEARAGPRPGRRVHHTDILAGNTNPKKNPFWGQFAVMDGAKRRPATLKTGTSNEARDLNAYGFIGSPDASERKSGEYALAAGAWNGNSDNSLVSSPSSPLFSIDVTTYVWQGFMEEATKGWSINGFGGPPDNIERASVDPWTGLLASAGGPSVDEIFIVGTKPTSVLPTDQRCGVAVLSNAGFEDEHAGLAGGGPRLADARAAWPGHPRRPPGHADRLLLQRPLHAVRQVVGRDRRRSGLRDPEPEPLVVARSVCAPDRIRPTRRCCRPSTLRSAPRRPRRRRRPRRPSTPRRRRPSRRRSRRRSRHPSPPRSPRPSQRRSRRPGHRSNRPRRRRGGHAVSASSQGSGL